MDDAQAQPDRRRIHPEVEMVLQAIQSRDDAITALRADVIDMPERIGAAIQAANMRTVSDPAFWAAAAAALRREARDQTGGFVLEGLRGVLRKIGWVLLIVGGVYEKGPAARAGVQQGDRIVALGDDDITDLGTLWRKLWATGPAGTPITLKLNRDGSPVTVRITSADRTSFLRAPRLH